MTVRVASWAFLGMFCALAAQGAQAGDAPTVTTSSADSLPVATDARLGGDDAQTRFVMDFSQKIEVRAFTLADPYRVVVDVPQVVFHLPPKTGEGGRGLIKAFRFGLVMQGGSRLVFDLTKPAKIEKAFVVDQTDNAPARLVLDLVSTDRETFLRRSAADNRNARADLPRTEAPATKPKDGDPRPLVMLDPGHGGIDTGTKGPNGEEEKDIVLNFAQRLRDRLEKSGKFRVLLTRNDDTFVALADRVRIARDAGATLFVSIHADSLPHGEGDAQGASIYTLSDTATDSEAARLAEKENRADVIAGVDLKSEPDDVAGILIDLAERETKSLSTQFAHKLAGDMKTVTRMHKKPLKSAGFRVLRAPDVASVLVELGYVSNRQDLQSLLSDAWRDRTATTIAQAIETFLSEQVAGAHTGSN
jgi:N-acetylmuramoyl-L-alanine amidase